MSLNKSQKQLIILGVVLAITVIVMGIFFFKPEVFVEEPYRPQTVDVTISKDVIENPEYRRLNLPVELPLVIGRLGRDNPFEPY